MGNRVQAQIRLLISAWIFICAPVFAHAQYDIYWTVEAKTAYGLLQELRIDESLNITRLQKITHPDNMIWPYLEDYAMFLEVFTLEDLKEAPAYLESSAVRLDQLSIIDEGNPLSMMMQAQMLLHQCAIRMQLNQLVAAASDLNKAFRMLKKNQKRHPDDLANLRLYAAIKVAFGAIPDEYRWLVSMVSSLEGSIDEGLSDLHKILRESTPDNNLYHSETVLLTALAEGKLNNKPAEGIALLHRFFGKNPINRLEQYVLALLTIDHGDTDDAIRILSYAEIPATALRIPFMDFMLGKSRLNRGDDNADEPIKEFLVLTKGHHYIKEAYQKLAWHSLLHDDRDSYFDYMQLVLVKGADYTDEDKQALREAKTMEIPHPQLLQCRLLFDGGYYEKASQILTEDFYNALTHRKHRLQYLYRKGRVLHALKSYAEALHYYSLTITAGRDEPYYYACSAALQCGIIHETLGSEGAAARYYQICLQIHPETYATGLHQKARMGLNRME